MVAATCMILSIEDVHSQSFLHNHIHTRFINHAIEEEGNILSREQRTKNLIMWLDLTEIPLSDG